MVTGTVRDDPSRQEEPGRVPPAIGHGERRKVSGFKSGACGQDMPAGRIPRSAGQPVTQRAVKTVLAMAVHPGGMSRPCWGLSLPACRCGAVEPQVPDRFRPQVDSQAGGVAVPGGQLIRRGKRAGAEPQLVIALAAVRQGAAEDYGDDVSAQVAVPRPVQSGSNHRRAQV
jgi:hypothetical protein